MKNRLIGWITIIFATILIFKAWDTYRDIWYLLTEMPDHRPTMDYFIIVGQGVVYLTLVSVAILFGRSLLGDNKEKRIARWPFLTILTVWILLEIPIYNCAFGQSRHSFWFSQKSHFH